jgi:hypothetical protein
MSQKVYVVQCVGFVAGVYSSREKAHESARKIGDAQIQEFELDKDTQVQTQKVESWTVEKLSEKDQKDVQQIMEKHKIDFKEVEEDFKKIESKLKTKTNK